MFDINQLLQQLMPMLQQYMSHNGMGASNAGGYGNGYGMMGQQGHMYAGGPSNGFSEMGGYRNQPGAGYGINPPPMSRPPMVGINPPPVNNVGPAAPQTAMGSGLNSGINPPPQSRPPMYGFGSQSLAQVAAPNTMDRVY